MRTLVLALSSALPLVCGFAPAMAQQVSPVGPAGIEPDLSALGAARPEPAGPLPAPFATAALDDRALGTVAGREDTRQVAQTEQVAGVSRNSVGDNAVTGEARIDGNAFQNMSGLSILNVNTGNNVAINAAMTVNISIQSGP